MRQVEDDLYVIVRVFAGGQNERDEIQSVLGQADFEGRDGIAAFRFDTKRGDSAGGLDEFPFASDCLCRRRNGETAEVSARVWVRLEQRTSHRPSSFRPCACFPTSYYRKTRDWHRARDSPLRPGRAAHRARSH